MLLSIALTIATSIIITSRTGAAKSRANGDGLSASIFPDRADPISMCCSMRSGSSTAPHRICTLNDWFCTYRSGRCPWLNVPKQTKC